METEATLYLLSGKMASGKSTLAAKMSNTLNVVVFSEDELLASLYPGAITDVSAYVKYSSRVKAAVEPLIIEFLRKGVSLILDFPANTVAQRAWLIGLANESGVRHELHYIELSDARCKEQLQKRAKENPERAATDTVAMFDAINRYFEPPTAAERLNIIRSNP